MGSHGLVSRPLAHIFVTFHGHNNAPEPESLGGGHGLTTKILILLNSSHTFLIVTIFDFMVWLNPIGRLK